MSVGLALLGRRIRSAFSYSIRSAEDSQLQLVSTGQYHNIDQDPDDENVCKAVGGRSGCVPHVGWIIPTVFGADEQHKSTFRSMCAKDCYSCHSNQRKLAWFDEIVGYWLVRHDVSKTPANTSISPH